MTKPALPSSGGSFVRKSDGSLARAEPPQPMAKPSQKPVAKKEAK